LQSAGAQIFALKSLKGRAGHPLTIIDMDQQISNPLPILDAMIQDGIVATSIVEATRYPSSESANLLHGRSPGNHVGMLLMNAFDWNVL
jgi:hypothetical protein